MSQLQHHHSPLLLIFLVAFACLTGYIFLGSHGDFSSWRRGRAIVVAEGHGEEEKAAYSAFFAKWNASDVSLDRRGWVLDPVAASIRAGITGFHLFGTIFQFPVSSFFPSLMCRVRATLSGGATTCKAVHVGQIKPGTMRGNHRHLHCNESFIIWGAKTKFRLESLSTKQGYIEAEIGAEEVAIAAGPAGLAHAVVNVDQNKSTYFIGCQDGLVDLKDQMTQYKVWSDM